MAQIMGPELQARAQEIANELGVLVMLSGGSGAAAVAPQGATVADVIRGMGGMQATLATWIRNTDQGLAASGQYPSGYLHGKVFQVALCHLGSGGEKSTVKVREMPGVGSKCPRCGSGVVRTFSQEGHEDQPTALVCDAWCGWSFTM